MAELEKIEAHLRTLGLSEDGIALVLDAAKAPVCRVEGNGISMVTRFQSAKMRSTTQANSKLEYATTLRAEEDEEVLWFFDQPCVLPLEYFRNDGKKVVTTYTPDYLVITIRAVYLVECKFQEKLAKESQKSLERYRYCEVQREYVSEAVEAALEGTGIGFKVVSETSFSRVRLANTIFLLDYLRPSQKLELSEKLVSNCRAVLQANRQCSIAELIHSVQDLTIDDVLYMVRLGALFCDLENDQLASPETCLIFASTTECNLYAALRRSKSNSQPVIVADLQEGSIFKHGNQTWKLLSTPVTGQHCIIQKNSVDTGVEHLSIRQEDLQQLIDDKVIEPTSLPCKQDIQVQLLLSAKPKHQKAAIHKLRVIELYLSEAISRGEALKRLGKSDKQFRRYLTQYRIGMQQRGNALPELLGKNALKGNYEPRVSEQSVDLAKQVIKDKYLTPDNLTAHAAFRVYSGQAKTLGLKRHSYNWFTSLVGQWSEQDKTFKRKGHKQGRMKMPPQTEEGLIDTLRGDRAFQLVHIDSTQIDLTSIFPGLENIDDEWDASRAWLTLAVDAYSDALLSFFLTYQRPKIDSVMMTLRELVRRHSRVPESIIVDGGKEFENTPVEVFCSRFNITIHSRKSMPKGGAAVERKFYQANKHILHNLQGNTQLLKLPRQLTKKVNPYQNAVWYIDAIDKLFAHHFYNVYNKTDQPSHRMPPDEVIEQSFERHGSRPERQINVDRADMKVMLLPPDRKKPTRLVDPVKGVTRLGHYFYHEKLNDARWAGKNVEIRYDPEDNSYLYCLLGEEWVECKRIVTEDVYVPGASRAAMTKHRNCTSSFNSPEARADRLQETTDLYEDMQEKLIQGELVTEESVTDDQDFQDFEVPTIESFRAVDSDNHDDEIFEDF